MTGRARYCAACKRRHFVHEVVPEMPYDPRIPLVRLANVFLSVMFLYAVLAVWVLSLLNGVTL